MIELATIDEAWSHFEREVFPHIRDDGERTEEARIADEALARFVRAHPGDLERRLLAAIPRMAAAGRRSDDDPCSDLSRLIDNSGKGGPIDATIEALDPVALLRLCATAGWHHLGPDGMLNCAWPAADFAVRIDRDQVGGLDLTPEMRDALGPRPMPDVLPANLDGMSPRDIEAILETYVGVPIEVLEARLRRPGGTLGAGFLAEEDRLGQIIWEDARKLRNLGVNRHVLVDRIERAMKRQNILRERQSLLRGLHDKIHPGVAEAWIRSRREKMLQQIEKHEAALVEVTPEEERGFRFEVRRYGTSLAEARMDPFHTTPEHMMAGWLEIKNHALPGSPGLRGSPMAIPLIRRLCFFEGHVAQRIEPEIAARVLGFVT